MLAFFVILSAGCQAEDLDVRITEAGMAIRILYKWPEAMFGPQHLFEGHVDWTGSTMVNLNSAKAAAFNDMEEKTKRSNKEPATTKLVINLERRWSATS